jgi:hypothetical protein
VANNIRIYQNLDGSIRHGIFSIAELFGLVIGGFIGALVLGPLGGMTVGILCLVLTKVYLESNKKGYVKKFLYWHFPIKLQQMKLLPSSFKRLFL